MSDLEINTRSNAQPQKRALTSIPMRMIRRISAHLYTMFSGFLGPQFPPQRSELRIEIPDPEFGVLPLYAHEYQSDNLAETMSKLDASSERNRERIAHKEAPQKLCVLVHGLASTPNSRYLAPYVHQGLDSGYDVIALALRGSVGEGVAHYHAGLTADVRELLASERCARYDEVILIGFSLGGQVVLRCAYEGIDPRVKSVGAVCPPIDLGVVQRHLDRPGQTIYRRFLLAGLKTAYLKIWDNADRSGTPLEADLDRVLKVQTIYGWDEHVVLPRFGFESVLSYQRQFSMSAEQLSQLTIPSYLVFSRFDPVVPLQEIKHHIEPLFTTKDERSTGHSQAQAKVVEAGGHIRFPGRVDLNIDLPPSGMPHQLFAWMRV